MYCGLFMARTCSRFSTSRLTILRQLSRLGVQQSTDRINGPSKYLCISGVISRRTCSTQGDEDLSTEQTKYLELPEGNTLKISQELTNENANDDSECSMPELFEGNEDTSDPCAGLDLNDITTNENVDVSKNTNEFAAPSLEDERFPLPSEPIDKG